MPAAVIRDGLSIAFYKISKTDFRNMRAQDDDDLTLARRHRALTRRSRGRRDDGRRA